MSKLFDRLKENKEVIVKSSIVGAIIVSAASVIFKLSVPVPQVFIGTIVIILIVWIYHLYYKN